MKIKNINKDVKDPLELHVDDRGSIVDVFYKHNIEHVAVVTSEPNVLRGNHYHKNSTCLLYTSPSPRDRTRSRMPSSA